MTGRPSDSTVDVCQDLINRHTDPKPTALVPEISLRTARDFERLWEEYAGIVTTGGQMPFWSVAWTGGQALARFLLDHPEIVAGRAVLDLGAGSGICGIAAAMAGARAVTACDIDACARIAIEINAAENKVELEITEDDVLGSDPTSIDVLLVGDLFYDRVLAHLLLPWLDRAAALGSTILIGDPGRMYSPSNRLECLATYTVSGVDTVEDASTRPAGVYALSPAAGPLSG